MRKFRTLLVAAALVVGAASILPADAQAIQVDRASYTQRARDDVHAWETKLNEFGDRTAAKGDADKTAIKLDLQAAWVKTKTEEDKLETASADGWQSAKASYETASHDLIGLWDKIRPEDK